MSGAILAEWSVRVDGMKVRDFARAVHDDHAGEGEAFPPPTFPVVLSSDFVERLVTELLPLDRTRTVHGEQEYEYLRPLRVGETLRCRARIVADAVKQGRRGGAMRILVTEVELSEADSGKAVAWERMTSVETQALGEGSG